MNNKNPLLSELEELQLKASRVTGDSLASTRRMLILVEESDDAGRRTLDALHEQREQLNHVEECMDNINNDMKRAEKALNNFKRCCNICSCSSDTDPYEDKCSTTLDTTSSLQFNTIVNQPRSINNSKGMIRSALNTPACDYITRITGDAHEDEMNSNLIQVNSVLGRLRNMAQDMNSELQTQNEQIKRTIDKGDSNNIRLSQVKTLANNLLNSN